MLARVAEGKVTLMEAAALLRVGYRHVRRLFHRYTTHGRRGMRHGNVGRRSNRAHPAAEQEYAVQLIRTHYSGPATGAGQRFGPGAAPVFDVAD